MRRHYKRIRACLCAVGGGAAEARARGVWRERRLARRHPAVCMLYTCANGISSPWALLSAYMPRVSIPRAATRRSGGL
jgi:hypothetical protein